MVELVEGKRVSAVLMADVAGYSRLMGQDLAVTVSNLKSCRGIFARIVSACHGRIVNAPGDSVLAEFGTACDALQGALQTQRELERFNESVPTERRMRFRIGISLGEVLADEDGIYGDEVNIAARLEALAEPGGICITSIAHCNLTGPPLVEFEFLGEQRLKNINRPIPVYRALTHAKGTRAAPAKPPPGKAPAGVERPSIAVLPFSLAGAAPDQDFLAEGLTEDIITDLSHFSQLRVIARNSTFRYQGGEPDLARVGQELGVRYLLVGSMRRRGESIRITAQLLESETLAHVWAQRYDRPLAQVFAVQDELVRAIVAAIVGNVLEADLRRAERKETRNLSAYESVLLGRRYLRVASTGDNLARARDAFEAAIAADPRYADAYHGLSRVYLSQSHLRLNWKGRDPIRPEEAAEQAEVLARRAVELEPRSERAHATLGEVLLLRGRYPEAIEAMEKGVALNPNDPEVHLVLGLGYLCVGRHEDALRQHMEAHELEPYPSPFMLAMRAWTLFALRSYDAAREDAERAVALSPRWRMPYNILVGIHAERGDLAGAKTALQQVLALTPDFSRAELERTTVLGQPEDRERWLQAHLQAGLAE